MLDNLTADDFVRVAYSGGSKQEYSGRVEKVTPTHLTLELPWDGKSKKQYRCFHRNQITKVDKIA